MANGLTCIDLCRLQDRENQFEKDEEVIDIKDRKDDEVDEYWEFPLWTLSYPWLCSSATFWI